MGNKMCTFDGKHFVFPGDVDLAPPATLDDVGRAKWAEMLPELLLPSPANLTALEVYCVAYARWVAAQRWLAEYGDVMELVNDKGVVTGVLPAPKLEVAARAEKAMREALARLPMRLTT